jgi:hypothetical protein
MNVAYDSFIITDSLQRLDLDWLNGVMLSPLVQRACTDINRLLSGILRSPLLAPANCASHLAGCGTRCRARHT